MKIAFGSDLHNEFWRDEPAPSIDGEADILVIAGDLDTKVRGPKWLAENYRDKVGSIYYVPGNHEYYHGYIFETGQAIQAACEEHGINFIGPGKVYTHIFNGEGFQIFGATLWTDYEHGGNKVFNMMVAKDGLNDHRIIGNRKDPWSRFLPYNAAEIHAEHLAFIKRTVKLNLLGKNIVVTHHAPHRNSINLRYAGDGLNSCYASDILDEPWGEGQPVLWIHGHMHDPSDYEINGTRVVAHPRAYPRELYRSGEYKLRVIEV